MSALDQVLAFCKVISSTVAGDNSEARYNLTGASGFRLDASGRVVEGQGDDADDAGEQAHEQEAYGPLGWIGRPLPPDGELYAEALAARTDDGLVPVAWRDLRIARAVNPGGAGGTPAEGQLMFAGYRGSFLSHAIDGNDDAVSTWYLPFDFDASGVPQRAHVVSMDRGAIQLVHASGLFVSLTDDAGGGSPGIAWAVDASTFGSIKPGEFNVNAAKILLRGNVYVGAAAEAGVPLLAGPASPPCPSLFVSPV